VKAPERIETSRLILRKPALADADAVFGRYASDPEVTRFLGWPRHRSVEDTRAFMQCSEAEWDRWPAGPYLIESRAAGVLLGSTGFSFETPYRAATGYVLAKDAWGAGVATEALGAIVVVSRGLELPRLYALCHTGHAASARVLEKCGFRCEGTLRRHSVFPNLDADEVCDVLCYAVVFDGRTMPAG
jgi:[ribosomal protein S5]-alanine N-acetyltransferase